MSKITKFLWSLLPLLSLLFVVSCGEDPVDNGSEITSVIKLKSSVVEAKAKADTYTVNYTIENPVDGETVNVVTDAEWISNIDRTTAGVIKFDVAENTVEQQRSAVVTVEYKNAEPATFTVKQEAAKPQNLTFTVDEVSMGYLSCTFDIYPADQNTAYLVNVYNMEYIDMYELYDDDALFNDDMEYFAWLGQFHGLTATDIIDIRKIYGNTYEKEVTGCSPATEYLLYMYYIDVNTGERLSDIYRYPFTTPAVPLQEMVFETSYTVNGPEVHIEAAAPANYLDAFYFDVMPKEYVDAQAAELGLTVAEFFELWWNTTACNEMAQDYSPESILASVGSYTSDEYDVELLAETDYYLFAMALNEWALCSSVPQYEVLTTGKVEPSTNEITIIVTDITPNGATIRYRTSNNDPYVSGWATKDEWNKFGSSERERIQNIIKAYDFGADYLHGDITYTEKMGLTPETEYVVFAMGYRAGVATTKLFSTEFKTLSDAPSTETIALREMGYFDITALNEVDPTIGSLSFAQQYAIYPMELIKSSEDLIGYTSNWLVSASNKEWYSYEYVMSGMIGDGPAPQYTYVFVEYGMNNLITAVGRDAEGRYTEMYYNYFYCDRSNCNADVQSFIDWRNEWWGITAVPASVVYDAEQKVEEAPLFTRKAVVVESPAKVKFSSKQASDNEVVTAADALVARR